MPTAVATRPVPDTTPPVPLPLPDPSSAVGAEEQAPLSSEAAGGEEILLLSSAAGVEEQVPVPSSAQAWLILALISEQTFPDASVLPKKGEIKTKREREIWSEDR